MTFVIFFLFLAAVVIFFAARSRALNGERIVHGYEPLKENTVKAEEICSSFDLPARSVRLNTRIISKSYSGLVTNEYSTDLHCLDADLFFKQNLQHSGWSLTQTEQSSFLIFWPEIHAEFRRDEFSAYVDCKEMKDYRGIRYLSVGCRWGP